MTRSLLAYCPGYPFVTESLMPRRLLGELAAALCSGGHDARVLDGGTIPVFARAYGPACGAALTDAEDAAACGGWRLRRARVRAAGALAAGQARHAELVAEEARACPPCGLAVIEVARRQDVASSLALASAIRAHAPDAAVLAAGEVAEWYAASLLGAASPFDAVCRGDAEAVAPAVADCLATGRNWRTLPGLLQWNGGRTVATNVWPALAPEAWPAPLYAREVYPALHGPGKLRVFPVAESRGGDLGGYALPRPPLEHRQARVRPAGLVCGEVADLARTMGARAFHFTGSGTPSAQLDALAYELLARCLHIRYSRAGHVRNLDPLTAATLRTSGCQAVALGIDTGSQRLLTDFYGHSFGVSETVQVVRACSQAGIFVQMHFTYPCPEDDHHTLAESLRLARCAEPAAVTVGLPELVPGSAWHANARAFGFRAAAPAASPAHGARVMRGWSRVSAERARADFHAALAAQGHLLDAGAVEALLGRLAAGPGGEADFAVNWRRALRLLDSDALCALTAEFNACAVLPVNTVTFPGPVTIRAVVGN